MAFSNTFDTATPAGSDDPAEADDRMREIKAAVQERENVDHYWPLTGTQVSDDDAGEHRKVLFHAPIAATPTVAPNHGDLRIKDVANGTDTKAEVVYTNEAEAELQLTANGKNLANNVALTADNAAGNAAVNLIKATTGDIPEILVGAVLSANTAPSVDAAIANKKYVDDQLAFSAWTTEDADAATLAAGTTYTATSDGFVSLYATKTPVTVLKQTVVYGGITTVLRSISSGNTDHHISGTFSVASGETFVITDNTGGSTTVINWRSVGTLSKPTK